MNEKYVMNVGSNDEFEDLVAYIWYDNSLIAIISQENGFDNLQIHMPLNMESPYTVPFKQLPTFDLKELEQVISNAKENLWRLRRY